MRDGRGRMPETKNLLAAQYLHPFLPTFVRPFALSKLHARSLDYSRFAAVVGRGRGPHALDRQFERGGFRGGSASLYPKPRGRLLGTRVRCLHFGIDWARHSGQQTSVAVGDWNARRFQRIRAAQ